MRSIFSITAAGGAEAAVIISTRCGNVAALGCRRVDQHAHDDRRAAQMGDAVVGDGGEDRLGGDAGAGRHGCRPAAVTVQGKHQPLQWNIGSVQR